MKANFLLFLRSIPIFLTLILLCSYTYPVKEYEIFQFPQHMMPRIDGDFSDWEMVPETYSIGLDRLMDTKYGKGTNLDPQDYDVKVKVGWVKT